MLWRRRWVRVVAVLLLLLALLIGAGWFVFARDLPSVSTLKTYEPPLPTNVRDTDGLPVYSYARERRVELSYAEYPPLLIHAFLAAEDKTFFQHHGIDITGVGAALIDYVRKAGSGERARGGSTITQQVAKNLLVGNAYSPSRKVREAILAWRIEDTLTKQQILELYLNQIALGRNAYGVEAASHAYFNKELPELTLPQAALLAALPKGPSYYDPYRHPDRATERRNYVLNEMLRARFIDQRAHDEAIAAPLGVELVRARAQVAPGYFMEEVRRQLSDKFGETSRDGPYSIYAGGLWVRTSFDQQQQQWAERALQDGLLRYDRGRGWAGPLGHATVSADNWLAPFVNTSIALDYNDWRAAVVIGRGPDAARLGFADGSTGTMPRSAALMPVRGKGGVTFDTLTVGDVIAVAPEGRVFALRAVPKVSGAFMVEEPATGRVRAMQGGFDARLQSFNRVTQAFRQPGSTIKPIVYSAALANGMTPATILVDGPYCVFQGARLGQKCFRNFTGGGSGPHTLRWGLEQSRNLMTVRAADQTGMPKVVGLMDRMGIGKYEPYLSYSLGAGVTTVSRMVNAYTTLANQGRAHPATLIDFVQDRHGKVIWPENYRPCVRCNARDWDGKAMPRPQVRQRQVLDAMTAYQMVHIAEGVIQRGTATVLRDLNRPMFGKTGTNTGPTDVWFIGGTPQLIAGTYIGYDQPRPLGGYAQGGTLAAPIFKQWALKAYQGLDPIPFAAPAGIRLVRIDRASGHPVYGGWPTDDPKSSIIWEAFKPESEPRRAVRHSLYGNDASDRPRTERPVQDAPPPPKDDFLQREGGIY